MWTALAALVAVLHAVYLLFQGFGGLLALRHPRWLLPHAAAVTWGVVIVVVQGSCPLTVLERHLLTRAGETPYGVSYLDHYLFGTALPDGWQTGTYVAHLVGIAGIWVWLAARSAQARRRGPGTPALGPGVA